MNIDQFHSYFFIGIAGTGMSAIAQYLKGIGKKVSGSDRLFNSSIKTETEEKLNNEGINTYKQDGSGINDKTDVVILSTAIENDNPEIQKARQLGLPLLHRSELLAAITLSKKTIAVSGTSGKSTTSAMIYHILEVNGQPASFIGGAGLISLQNLGKIGNTIANNGKWLVIEADESDGSLVKYHPEVGLILNIDKDHKELIDLVEIFKIFKENTRNKLIVNQSHLRTKELSVNDKNDFGYETLCGFMASDFKQDGFSIHFRINNIPFELPLIGKHNMENACAAVAASYEAGISIEESAEALKSYLGIYRRHQLIGIANEVFVVDDYAHNPAKLAASIQACQFTDSILFIWFQPHGFQPTKFLRNEFVDELCNVLRKDDEIWMSEIYYAGGTAAKDISAEDLINDIKLKHEKAFFVENRDKIPILIKSKLRKGDILLLTGARDPSLADYAKFVYQSLIIK